MRNSLKVAQLDIRLGHDGATRPGKRNAFDMLTEPGFAPLAGMKPCHRDLRLSVWTILNTTPDRFMALLAPVCSSFSGVNQATHKRSAVLPWGDTSLESVRVGNCLMSRSILLAFLCWCLGGAFLMEQPGSSRVTVYPRFEWFVSRMPNLWRAAWWGRHYGALTPKRHRAWSNSPKVGLLDRGRLSKVERERCIVKTTDRKINRQGKKSFAGNRFLKGTQSGAHCGAYGSFDSGVTQSHLVCVSNVSFPFSPRIFSFHRLIKRWSSKMLQLCGLASQM